MTAIDQIIEWANNEIPAWQADAVRRILTQPELTTVDKIELFAILKESHGLGDPQVPAPKPKPIKAGQISGAPKDKVAVILKALNEVKNVNAIPSGSYIPFGHEGLTIIYGENGAGKSGYARVLKRACSAKDSTQQIHPNVYEASADPASATFKIAVQGRDEDIQWVDGQVSKDVLANIVVFDARGARVIVDEENDISFRPYGTHAFTELGELIKEFHDRLDGEKPVVQKLLFSEIPIETKSGNFIDSISDATTSNEIDSATKWTVEDGQGHEQLKQRIADYESPERSSKIRRLKTLADGMTALRTGMVKIEGLLAKDNENKIIEAARNLITAKEALELLTQQSAINEPLAGVGTPVWQALYLAAKEYSISHAYPGKSFPSAEENDLCVLCMQPLDPQARERFRRFKNFMEQSVKKAFDSASSIFRGLLDEISALDFGKFQQAGDAMQEMKERNTAVHEEICLFSSTMKKRADELGEMTKAKIPSPVTQTPVAPPLVATDAVIASLQRELKALEDVIKPEDLQAMKESFRDLEARRLLSKRKDEINNHVKQLKKRAMYDRAIEETNLFAVSARGKKIISESTTPALQDGLRSELNKLGASYLPLEHKPIRVGGEVFHKLVFTKGALPKKVLLTDILSEGEQRVVAIAGFLAEQTIFGGGSPIVFDDPVSSLDHKFRDRIAQRLAEEAQKRQVIIFTHDIAFLVELEGQAAQIGNIKVAAQTIRRKGQIPGLSAKGNPWHVMKVGERLELLNSKVSELEPLYNQDAEKYNEIAANIYGMLRETWEALVEEDLLNHVVRRHGPAVQTKRLEEVEVTTEDYRTIHFAMEKSSEWMVGHDKSKTLDVNRPSPTELRCDIQRLVELRKAIRDRRKNLKTNRTVALQPLKPEMG